MRTVFGSLPFYDSLAKQDVARTNAIIPVHCPRTQLPPFQWNAEADDMGDVTKIELFNNNYNASETATIGNDWSLDVGFDTFDAVGYNINTATNAAGIAYCISENLSSVIPGTKVRVKLTLVRNSGVGTEPVIFIAGGSLPGSLPTTYPLVVGANDIEVSSEYEGTVYLYIYRNGATDFTVSDVTITTIDNSYDITSFFPTLPTATVWSTNTYGIYNGDTLNYLLPLGLYYVKITTDNGYKLYSDWVMIQNIYENLITAWTNADYEALITSGTQIISAINTAANGGCISDTFQVIKGETITVIFYYTATSGTIPNLYLINNGWTLSDSSVITEGLNIITLTAGWTGTASIVFSNNASNVNFSTSKVWVQRTYSPHFIQLAFKNTNSLGDIFYDGTFEQKVWLDAILNTPTHETVTLGEEKDGEFIAEKLISKYIYSIVAYVSRGLYKCLSRLPLHDTITITDEVGDTYSPAVGNVTVEQPEWIGFETCKLPIKFNDGENSNFVWTK